MKRHTLVSAAKDALQQWFSIVYTLPVSKVGVVIPSPTSFGNVVERRADGRKQIGLFLHRVFLFRFANIRYLRS